MSFFWTSCRPLSTHQQKKVAVVGGKPRMYEPQRLKDARSLLMLALSPYRPRAPFAGAVRLAVRWQFPKGRHKSGYKTTRPDTDNLQKLLKDCMTDAGFWKDDALVACEYVEKRWAEKPGIYVRVEAAE